MILRSLPPEPFTPVEDMIVLAVTGTLVKIIIAFIIWRLTYV